MNKKCIALIPARGGSKRIVNKNIKLFDGKPLISYSIEAAINSGLFERVIVSTDSQEIADILKPTVQKLLLFDHRAYQMI